MMQLVQIIQTRGTWTRVYSTKAVIVRHAHFQHNNNCFKSLLRGGNHFYKFLGIDQAVSWVLSPGPALLAVKRRDRDFAHV